MADRSDPWAVWLEEHGPGLVLLARQWANSQADAEDIVQEAFVRFWRSRQRVAEPAGYLYACVKRCAMDATRARTRQVRREQRVARPEADSLFEGPLEQRDRAAAVESAVGRLPEAQREVLVMRIWGGLSFPQIAAALDVSPDTAASRFRYALAKLQAELAETTIG